MSGLWIHLLDGFIEQEWVEIHGGALFVQLTVIMGENLEGDGRLSWGTAGISSHEAIDRPVTSLKIHKNRSFNPYCADCLSALHVIPFGKI